MSNLTAAQKSLLAACCWETVRPGKGITWSDLQSLADRDLVKPCNGGFTATDHGIEVAVRLEEKGVL